MIENEDLIICNSCMYVVFEPKYCSNCHYPICSPCRATLDKNDFKACMTCAIDFVEADENDEEVLEAKSYLLFARFKCEATTGAKIANCKKEMSYDEFLKHVYKHHKQN